MVARLMIMTRRASAVLPENNTNEDRIVPAQPQHKYAITTPLVEFSEFGYDHKLSDGASLVSVASVCEELWIRNSSSYDTRFHGNLEIAC